LSFVITFLRTNPAVVAMLVLVLIATVVLAALGVYVSRLGMSLKPIALMAGFLGIIVGPQLAFHLGQALGVSRRGHGHHSAGWRWRPTVWRGPRWLVWLTG
jgi:hypothetical protein